KKHGYEVYFAGTRSKYYNKYNHIFNKIFWIRSNDSKLNRLKLTLGYSFGLEKRLRKIVEELRPDLIHAHNIFVAKYAHNLGIPMILDDHELYSTAILTRFENSPNIRAKVRKLVVDTLALSKRWREWEHMLAYSHPVITVSNGIAEYYSKLSKHVYVVPNYPSKDASNIFESINYDHKDDLCSVYVGMDTKAKYSAYRDILGLEEIFLKPHTGMLIRIGVNEPNNHRIRALGYLPMAKVFEVMYNECQIGLLPWKRHFFHKYCSPNKVYEYAYCGLWIITIDDIPSIKEDFGDLCDTFSNYDELRELLVYYNSNKEELTKKREAIFVHAKNNLIWERNEHKIIEAYKKA
ncbi:MAG: hypothetical protein D6752_06725, partial [Candidatus Nitrosothermus koennekii]